MQFHEMRLDNVQDHVAPYRSDTMFQVACSNPKCKVHDHVDLTHFFDTYHADPRPNNEKFECCVYQHINRTRHAPQERLVINVKLPPITFSRKAYQMCRCQQQSDGSWDLLVVDQRNVSYL